MALSLFSIGRHKEGWYNLYRSRTECETFEPLYVARKRFTKPMFNMQPLPATVHIHTDAGNGDNILLMRYLPLLAAKGYKVRYEAKENIVKLARDSFPEVEIIPIARNYPGTTDLPDFDYHIPIVDLPFIFQTDLDTIPKVVPYLKLDSKLIEKYKPYRGKIGICWATGVPIGHPFKRSIKFDLLKPIIDNDPSRFISLQTGYASDENDRIVTPNPGDWADTAALLENLDLIISIDTAIAHLAGAIGKPTWLMMHKYTTSFQFMAEYKDASWNTASPWYPSMRIFRQKTRDDWSHVITEIAAELAQRVQPL